MPDHRLTRGPADDTTPPGPGTNQLPRDGIDMTNTEPRLITLCGSMRHPDALAAEARAITLAGHIALAPIPVGAAAAGHRNLLDRLHRTRIDLAHEVRVVVVDGHIGDHTAGEIAYAHAAGKPINYATSETR